MTTVNLKAIDKKIATFTTSMAKMKDLAHEIIVMVIRHCAPEAAGPECQGSGDCTRALKLMSVLPKSWAAQMDTYLKDFTPIRVNVGNERVGFDPNYKKLESAEEKLTWWNVEAAVSTPFYEHSTEPEAKTYSFEDLVKLIGRVGQTIEKRIERGEVEPTDIESAQTMARAISALRFQRVEPANDTEKGVASQETEAAAA